LLQRRYKYALSRIVGGEYNGGERVKTLSETKGNPQFFTRARKQKTLVKQLLMR